MLFFKPNYKQYTKSSFHFYTSHQSIYRNKKIKVLTGFRAALLEFHYQNTNEIAKIITKYSNFLTKFANISLYWCKGNDMIIGSEIAELLARTGIKSSVSTYRYVVTMFSYQTCCQIVGQSRVASTMPIFTEQQNHFLLLTWYTSEALFKQHHLT